LSAHNQRLGRSGEQAAAQFLEAQGYTILDRNVHTPHGEIDLLAALAGRLVFVEVKTRSNQKFGLPEEAVTPAKLAHMQDAALHWIEANAEVYGEHGFQFDVVAVLALPDHSFECKHFPDVRA
jgi:putative endonuclease